MPVLGNAGSSTTNGYKRDKSAHPVDHILVQPGGSLQIILIFSRRETNYRFGTTRGLPDNLNETRPSSIVIAET